ncbi:hypothetical protein FHU38_001038 [Saccharomonospora amisosensis]|uniref:Uncharacterized protein n=1 Tax=Saccharomonospora amisosensis TaxID=1128677 RepID=A0A7X5UN39_9PSEU|nr:hypothetical protein [Saccharomonospora amisosensis]NIJ10694.1 hypothetical protein [Saccharomonospora amisosensis]
MEQHVAIISSGTDISRRERGAVATATRRTAGPSRPVRLTHSPNICHASTVNATALAEHWITSASPGGSFEPALRSTKVPPTPPT